MDAALGHADRPLTDRLRAEPARFDFYQLVRLLLLERGPELTRFLLGEKGLGPTIDERVRFRANLEMGFPAREVRTLDGDRAGPGGRVVVETGNYAIAGYLGPLPEALVERMRERMRDGDTAMAELLDVFNHRINVLRYRLKAGTRIGLNIAHPDETEVAEMLAALMGMAAPGLAQQLPIARHDLLGIAGLLGNVRRSAPVLTRVTEAFTGAKVALVPLVGAWRERQERDLTRLGRGARGEGLGRLARLGHRAFMPAARVRLHVGPLDYRRFTAFLPPARPDRRPPPRAGELPLDAHARLAALLRFLVDRRQDVWVHLRLAEGEDAPSRLAAHPGRTPTAQGARYEGLRLGYTAWLSGRRTRPREARFLVEAFPRQAAGGPAVRTGAPPQVVQAVIS